ncbi:ABC transporter ATP-binding protein [Alkalimonas amylolytica]|uniref:ABC-2 type transport system ATP-binding protein n=1 Tax=Alkalimonas amylolytica TaxID=152573 RepID=A0A1H4D742_ALKAM|nr:ABC transporter ATP-binding protein [Alkalimonas amylolytica]SEA68260.1 ABC-2 type transport system ATP-binding protein [Alkalimonas amylolytica]
MPAILEITALRRAYEGRQVLKDITASATQGDVIALLGKNGAGKTTLLETILGFAVPEQGEVRLFGTLSTEIGPNEKQRIGFVPQQDELLEQLTAEEHLKLFARCQPGWDHALCQRLCQSWDIPLARTVSKLSPGQRQKLAIILALSHKPELLILDEPVASLDPMARRQFLTELVTIAADQQSAIIFSSHIVTDMERVANKIWLLKDQQLVWQDEQDTLKEAVVRLHISARQPLPENLSLPHCLYQHMQDHQGTITLAQWHPEQKEELEQALQAWIRVEHLGLEDIFLEFHR